MCKLFRLAPSFLVRLLVLLSLFTLFGCDGSTGSTQREGPAGRGPAPGIDGGVGLDGGNTTLDAEPGQASIDVGAESGQALPDASGATFDVSTFDIYVAMVDTGIPQDVKVGGLDSLSPAEVQPVDTISCVQQALNQTNTTSDPCSVVNNSKCTFGTSSIYSQCVGALKCLAKNWPCTGTCATTCYTGWEWYSGSGGQQAISESYMAGCVNPIVSAACGITP